MHFFYLDESGCNGRDLTNQEQPIFVIGGIVLRDEGWNKTHSEFLKIIENYFSGVIPENFEFHTHDLFSPNGSGHFRNHTRERRNSLINSLLDLIINRKHHFLHFAIDKKKLNEYDTSLVTNKDYFDLKVPYIVGYDYFITICEYYTKNSLGKSARALIILDEKDIFIQDIESVTNFRRFEAIPSKRVKWISEFSYAVDSKKNTMIQLSDLLLFLTKKYLEIENGYRDNYPIEVKNTFREFYRKIHNRTVCKSLIIEGNRGSATYDKFLNEIFSKPTLRWNSKNY
ncbi:DUF3800 domain-containing protein [Chryseobacterium formosus]|uniref:DUF3800 domain-containing protein n=1 Tax=Chryseobacterium formosus TaxID=1537363 RepID=A0ABT3XQE1_9FLAO|nr:DUF3800 domain-containing protein [Chryseobacterium formosus]MCX8523155.1 DUF3800 domain-containing protein [Chryseobacterium formosus]